MPILPDTDTLDTASQPTEPVAPVSDNKQRNKQIKQEATACKQYRRRLVQSWTVSIDYRRGKPFASQTDEDRVAVNADWFLTKQKQAILFSQIPAVRVNHPPQTQSKEAAPWLHAFEQRINDIAVTAGIETAMDECLPDCINAAGFGVIMVAREAITDEVEVPKIDVSVFPPQLQAQIMQTGMMPNGSPVPMTTVPRVVDSRYTITRLSPADFLWPLSFVGSDFDNAPWIGREGRILWAEACKRWNLNPDDKDRYISGEDRLPQDKLTHDIERNQGQPTEYVSFTEIFYKEFQFDEESKSFQTIHHLVFLASEDEPVVDEPWKGQQFDQETNQLIGVLRYPIRVLSLSYITDEAIPPSDSAIGRSQVNELNKGRTQMILQRERNLPMDWFDVNRVDPLIQQSIMRGTWKVAIPVQGQGQNIIGSVPRGAMQQENFTFDKIAKQDLAELWQVGQGMSGADIETKAEVNAINGNMQTRISRERAKVGKFFCSITEVLGGLICLYEDPASFGPGFSPLVSRTLNYSILVDSTILLDSNQRLKRLMDFINFTAKSGWVNVEPVLREVATLSGLDPAIVIRPPSPKPPVEPNISLRLTGTEDLMNPLVLAFLLNSGQAPKPEQIEAAKKMIEASVTPPVVPPVPTGPGPGGMPPMMGPNGQPMPPGPGAPPPGVPQPPSPAPPAIGEAHPNWSALNRVNQRVLDRSEQ